MEFPLVVRCGPTRADVVVQGSDTIADVKRKARHAMELGAGNLRVYRGRRLLKVASTVDSLGLDRETTLTLYKERARLASIGVDWRRVASIGVALVALWCRFGVALCRFGVDWCRLASIGVDWRRLVSICRRRPPPASRRRRSTGPIAATSRRRASGPGTTVNPSESV